MRGATSVSVLILALTLGACSSTSSPSNTTGRPHTDSIRESIAHLFGGRAAAITIEPPQTVRQSGGQTLAEYRLGRAVAAQSGCLACHRIGEAGNDGPGPDLTELGGRLPRLAIERTLVKPTRPMPAFTRLPKAKFRALVTFLSLLR
jgi:mono/diheme cytochrome c family protein